MLRHALLLSLLLAPALSAAEHDPAALTAQVTALPASSPMAALHRAALQIAVERATATAAAGLAEDAQAQWQDIAQALAGPAPAKDTVVPPFLPPLLAAQNNPYVTDLDTWATALTAKPDSVWGKAAPGTPIFKGTGKEYGTRDQAAVAGILYWLVAHPQSPQRGNPELFTRMLRRVHAYLDDYEVRATKYQDDLNDFFALGPALYATNAILTSWPDLILPGQRRQWERAVTKARDFWLKVYQDGQKGGPYRMGRYANRDLGVANILLNAGQILRDPACLEAAKALVEAQRGNLFPDGAFAYIGTQNESGGYHDADTEFLGRYWLVSGDATARDLLVASQWYGLLSMEPTGVAEFWTAPSWKHTWNGSGSTGGELVAGVSGNGHLRTLLDGLRARRKGGGTPDPLRAMFYRTDVTPRPLPDHYTVIDRNLQGPRARYGRFSYALTTRTPNADEPGKATIAGAMVMDQDATLPYPLNAGVLKLAPQVRCQAKDGKKVDWASLTRGDDAAVLMARDGAAVSVTYGLHQSASSTKGADVPWKARQEWVAIRDRLVALIEIAPEGPQVAEAVTLNVLLGNGGTRAGPRQQARALDDRTWQYGDLIVHVVSMTFAQADLVPTTVRIAPAAELVLKDGRTDTSAPVDRPFQAILEIRPAWVPAAKAIREVPGGGLEVTTSTGTWTAWHHQGDAPATLTVPAGTLVITPGAKPQASTGPLTLPAQGRALTITGPDATSGQVPWASYAEVAQGTP